MDGPTTSRDHSLSPLAHDRTPRIFWAFALGHLIVWTALPMALYSALPMDSMEMHVWGQQWQWGYHKHPPLPAWIAAAATAATGGSVAGIFLASQLCVVASLWAAWRMGRSLLSPRAALLGATLLECCLFYNYESTILNNNIVLYAMWSLAILALFRALETGQLRSWIALGVCGGLGMLTKYTFAMLPLVMLVFLFAHPQARRVWKQVGPYLSAAIALSVFSPHIYWAYVNDFPPLHWAAQRAQHDSGVMGRVTNPLEFGFGQLAALLPLLLVIALVASWVVALRPMTARERFQRAYLAMMVLGPFALHLALSVAFNLKLRSIWGSFLWTFAGVLLLFCLRLRSEPHIWRRAFVGCTMMALLFVAARVVRTAGSGLSGRSPRELFDGASLARQVEEVWRQQYDGTPPIIAGDGWLGGTVALYGANQACVYGLIGESLPPNDPKLCPWMDDREFAQAGGVFLCNLNEASAQDSLDQMQQRFPNLQPVETLEIPYSGSTAPPARIAVAILPPSSSRRQAFRIR